MKRKLRSLFVFLLLATMLVNLPGVMDMHAFAEEESDAEEVFPEDSVCFPIDDTLGSGEPLEGEQTQIMQMDCPEGEPEEESLEALSSTLDGEDEALGADGEEITPENSMSVPSDLDDTLGGVGEDDDTLGASAYLISSRYSVSMKAGETKTVTLTAGGYSGSVYLTYVTNNTRAYSCSWGSWYRGSIPLRIKGLTSGSGTVTVYMRAAATGRILDYVRISINVQPVKNPSLTLSTSSVNIAKGKTQTVTVRVNNYSGSCYVKYSNSNSTAIGCSWGRWSGMTVPLNITGKNAGKGSVTIRLYSTAGRLLASATISASIYTPVSPSIKLSASSVSLKAGYSTSVKVTVSGVSGEYYLSYSQSNSNAFKCSWGSWSGSTVSLTITGKNAGTGTVTIYLKSKNGTILAYKTISPIKITALTTPRLTASSTNLSLSRSAAQSVTISYSNVTESIYLQYSTTNTSAYKCSWGYWNGSSIPLTITPRGTGSGTVTVYMKRSSNDATLASVKISVTVKGLSIYDVGYGFDNYSKPNISYNLCKYMFGNNMRALEVYKSDIGNGGCCFGFAASAALIDVTTSAPYLNSFTGSRSSISKLAKSDRSSSYGLSVTDFIEAMHISQVSGAMSCSYNLNDLVSTVKQQTDAGRPVLIAVRGYYNGRYGGHAILAFGYNQVSSTECRIRIYDSNHAYSASNMEETTLYVKRSSSSGAYNYWSYNMWSGLTWGSAYSGSSISYITFDTILNVWNNRGSLNMSNMNLVSTTEDNFSLYDFNGNLVVEYTNGEMTYQADNVIDLPKLYLSPNGDERLSNMFYVPIDLYTVVDGTPDTPMDIMLADEKLSVTLSTDADTFDLAADGQTNTVSALLAPDEGTKYTVSLGTMMGEDIEEICIEGLGTGEPISLGLDNGELSIMGADSASLSISTIGDSCTIDAECSRGGSISNKGSIEYPVGLNARYSIKPEEGYQIKSVYVDGEDVGPVDEYYFENINEHHTIFVNFSKDISLCTVKLAASVYPFTGTEIEPAITVLDGEDVLTQGVDYLISYANNTDIGSAVVNVTAEKDSLYSGSVSLSFEIKEAAFGTPDFVLPADLKEIKESAFEGCAASVVVVPDSCTLIGANAFRDASVVQIHLPEQCEIDDTAFSGCKMVQMFSKAGSSAESYCETHDNCIFVQE